MYDHLRGTLSVKQPTRVVVDVGGVGFELTIPLSSFDGLPAEGGPATLFTHLHVREDTLRLFGFATADERAFFCRLLDVSGIGPSVALSILSSGRYSDFCEAVLTEDVARLTRMKGVGKKLAQRIVLELKDVLEKEAPAVAAAGAASSGNGISPAFRDDAVAALVTLGFTRGQARTEVEKILAREKEPLDLGDVVRIALRSAR